MELAQNRGGNAWERIKWEAVKEVLDVIKLPVQTNKST